MARIRDIELVRNRESKVLGLLYDFGPHRRDEIVKETDLSEAVVVKTLQNLSSEGKVAFMKRGNNRYWLLAQDA